MSTVASAAGLRPGDPAVRLDLGDEHVGLSQEVAGIPAERWSDAAARGDEAEAVELLAGAGGGPIGPLAPTPALESTPKLRALIGALGAVAGWSRLVRFPAGGERVRLLPPIDLYSARRLAVLIPLQGAAGPYEPGSAWVLDPWHEHVVATGAEGLTALLVRCEVSAELRAAIASGELAAPAGGDAELRAERFNHSAVLAPAELESVAGDLRESLPADDAGASRLVGLLGDLALRWRAIWSEHAAAKPGWASYRQALSGLDDSLAGIPAEMRIAEGSAATAAARRLFVRGAFNLELASRPAAQARGRGGAAAEDARLRRPVFIVAPPSSGAEELAAVLAEAPRVWHLDPSADPIADMPAVQPERRGWDSDRLSGNEAMAQVAERFRNLLVERVRDRNDRPPPEGAAGLRVIHGSVANALRIPFLARAIPDAIFVFVLREPRESLAGALERWRSGEAVSHAELPEWSGEPWSLPLTPEWRRLNGRPLAEVVAEQWAMLVRVAIADLESLPADRWAIVDYAALRERPQRELSRLAAFADLEWDPAEGGEEAVSFAAADSGDPEVATGEEIEPVLPLIENSAARAREWLAGAPEAPDGDGGGAGGRRGGGGHPLRSVNTASLPQVLQQLNATLLLSTYQSGRLVAVRRAPDGGVNSHFRTFDSPMGLATHRNRLAVGTRSQVFEYQNVPAVAAKIQPPGSHDGCYVPRRAHFTGDIRIHEIGYAGDELWIVNTRFSCLATLDGDHSFVPRWRPPFVTGYAAEDRCHLNGMAIVDGEVRYVSALGRSDTAGGWRENKAAGGILMHVPSGEIITEGLSMPHSPRWYRDRLWVLESGEGGIGYVDLDTGKVETVAQLPGFTRGLAFAGPLAFVGLSEVRESMTFGGLPITGRLEERECGVWIVNIETGQTIGFMRFEGAVQEVFAVELLRGMRFPEIVEHGSPIVNQAFVLPDEAMAEAVHTPDPKSGPDAGGQGYN